MSQEILSSKKMESFVIVLIAIFVNGCLAYEVRQPQEPSFQQGLSSFGGYFHHTHGITGELSPRQPTIEQYQWIQPANEKGKIDFRKLIDLANQIFSSIRLPNQRAWSSLVFACSLSRPVRQSTFNSNRSVPQHAKLQHFLVSTEFRKESQQ